MQSEEDSDKKMQKNEQSLRKMRQTINGTNIMDESIRRESNRKIFK